MLPQSCLGTRPFSNKTITGHTRTCTHGHIHAHTLHTWMHTHMHRSTCTHMQVILWDIGLRSPLDTKIYICSSPFHKMTLPCAHPFEAMDSLLCLSLIQSIGFSGGIQAPLPPYDCSFLPHSDLNCCCSLSFRVARRRQYSHSQLSSVFFPQEGPQKQTDCAFNLTWEHQHPSRVSSQRETDTFGRARQSLSGDA